MRLSRIKTDDESIKDYLFRIRNPDMHHRGDVVTDGTVKTTLSRVNKRLYDVRKVGGFGNFNVLSFDEMLKYSQRYSRIGEFTPAEVELLESLFYEDASRYGFYGKKPLGEITQRIDRREVVKIPRTGHFLFAGEPQALYEKVRKQIGDSITLTSGVRNVVKQMQLFVAKAARSDGNLSLASRSLAPPRGIRSTALAISMWVSSAGARAISPMRSPPPMSSGVCRISAISRSAIRKTTALACALNPGTSR